VYSSSVAFCSAGDKDTIKGLKDKIKEQTTTIAEMAARLAAFDRAKTLELSNMELKTKLTSKRCKDNFKELKLLQMSLYISGLSGRCCVFGW
jgi:hypothetical protein